MMQNHYIWSENKFYTNSQSWKQVVGISSGIEYTQGQIQGPPLTTKNEAPAPKFYKIEAPEWQF